MNREEFLRPAAIFRAAPFWSWNDDLQNDELERQARDMGGRGWGGYFMHSRVGLVTPYLGEEWMDRIRHTVEVSAEAGLLAYLYDEDKWPSGYAGGIVPRVDPELRNTALQRTFTPPPAETNAVLALFAKQGSEWVRIGDESEAHGAQVAYVSRWVEPMGNPWFNGTAYVDLMNPEAVEEFFESTLEPYAEVVGDHFGTTIPGCFTDEPSYIFWGAKGISRENTVPWTGRFAEEFKWRWGYDILDHVMSVFEPVGDHQRVRYHFWRTATELFLEAFSEPYGRWCREHGLQMTGHYMCEDDFVSQIQWIGAAMPHYEHMGWPGMDHLSRNIDNLMTARQVTSVAHQLGKARTLSELYGCSGQNFTFEGRKWIADWHFVHGINLMNPHLALYTMRGERKRDYPPTLSYQQPWWRFNNLIADYKARLSYALTQGRRVTQVLVIHTIESAWSVYAPGAEGHARSLSNAFDRISRWLLEEHYDFDYADESLLAKHGRIEGNRFRVGHAGYDLVILPPAVTLRRTTVDLLRKWMHAQGPVIAVKPIPRKVDGDAGSDAWEVLREAIVVEQDKNDMIGALSEMLAPNVEVLSPEGFPVAPVWFHQRRDGTQDIIFFANTDRTRGYQCEIVLQGSGAVEEWDPRTGEVKQLPVEVAGSHVVVDAYIDATGSLLLVHDHSRQPEVIDEADEFEPSEEIDLEGMWSIARRDPNAITLDMARWWLDGGGLWQGPDPLWKALGPVRGHEGEFALEYALEVDAVPDGEVFLVLETPEAFRLTINGVPIPDEDCGWWTDTTFRKRRITGLLRSGTNKIVLTGTATPTIELESVYVIGDFAVWTDDLRSFVLGPEETETPGGDLVEQGYPFYAGTISLTQTIDLTMGSVNSAVLVLDGMAAVVADVWVNGQDAGQAIWPPHEVEIGPYLQDGENTIRIDLVHSLRNLLGPHHHRHGELLSVGPGSFSDAGNWTDIYQFVPFGLSNARIVVTE